MARYGTQDKLPFTEDMVPKPQDPYGVSKLAGEEVLKVLAKVHGMEYVIVVPHNIIGIRQKYDDPYRNVVSIMINRMLQGKQPIIYGDGEQKRCFCFVDNVIQCLKGVAFADSSLINGEIINVGADETNYMTVNELANTIAKCLDMSCEPIYVPDRPQEVKLARLVE
jgi:UDP-glucose 4-epimerase